eukprot:SAG22_NODE_683_length_7924_cov_13.017508_8_plen_101_part_00
MDQVRSKMLSHLGIQDLGTNKVIPNFQEMVDSWEMVNSIQSAMSEHLDGADLEHLIEKVIPNFLAPRQTFAVVVLHDIVCPDCCSTTSLTDLKPEFERCD